MKKLMFVAVAALCGALFADDITSANVVGYTSKECTKGQWYMIGVGFEKTGGGALDIQKFITGLTSRTDNPAFIQVWNGTELETYQYTQGFDENWSLKDGWLKAGEFQLSTLAIPAGFTCWFKDPAANAKIDIAGQVVSTDSTTITTEANAWKMVANPFPIATKLNGGLIDWSNFTARTDTPDTIQAWSGSELITYQYTQGFDENWSLKDGWLKAGEFQLTTDVVPVGTGFWFKSPTGGDIIFNKTATK